MPNTVVPMREDPSATVAATPPAAPPATSAAALPAGRLHGPFGPLLLALVALLTLLLHQLWQLDQERRQVAVLQQAAAPQLAAAQQLRQSLDQLAADTQRLADSGNAPARVLVDELRRRGITINAAATPAPVPTGAAGPAPATPR